MSVTCISPAEIRTRIRAALAGSSSQQPVDVAARYKLGGKAVIDAALGEMLAKAELNTAWTMKGGVQKTLYWLTGVISPLGNNMFVINRPRMESARDRPSLRTPDADLSTPCADVRKNVTEVQESVTKVQESATQVKPIASISPAQKKEIPVNTIAKPHGGKQPSELNTAIYNKIIEHPGITQAALIKHAQHKCPDATEKQIKKTMLNMVHATKKIRVEGERGNYTYHLNTGVSQPQAKPTKPAKPAKPSKAVAAGKVIFGNEAAALRGDQKPTATPKNHVKRDTKAPFKTSVGQDDFSCLLQDDGSLCIVNGSGDVMLNPDQISRLQRFMTRYQIVQGVPA